MRITDKEIQDKAKTLKNLVSFKNKSEDYILDKAEELLHKEKAGTDVTSMFSDKKEIKQGRELLGKYLEDYTIEAISDKNTLKEVIYLEIIQQRMQEKLNEYYKKDSKAVPIQLVEIIHKNSEAILKLKSSLGLNKSKDKTNSVDALAMLKTRFQQWLKDNQATRTIICPHEKCGQMIMLKMRTEMWDAQRHPFFKDRILGNKHLIKLYQNKLISKSDVAKVLEVSDDYVDWLVDKWDLDKRESDETLKEVKVPKEQIILNKHESKAPEEQKVPKESKSCEASSD